jgi:hypothetical protein
MRASPPFASVRLHPGDGEREGFSHAGAAALSPAGLKAILDDTGLRSPDGFQLKPVRNCVNGGKMPTRYCRVKFKPSFLGVRSEVHEQASPCAFRFLITAYYSELFAGPRPSNSAPIEAFHAALLWF